MEQKLASHNSMTYLKPLRKWMRLFGFTAKCQSLDFLAQVNQGVEFFDLRLKWVDDEVHFGHGLITYSNDHHNPEFVLDWLNLLSARLNRMEGRKIYVRIICERPKDHEVFTQYCAKIDQHYKELVFLGGLDKKTWKVLYDFKNQFPKFCDKYSSQNNDTFIGTGWHLDDLWPRLYAFCFNKYWRKKHSHEDCFLMQDFIGVY